MSVDENTKNLTVVLNAAELGRPSGDKSIEAKINAFIRVFRNWLIVTGNPQYNEAQGGSK